jgi:putative acetyltransferase
MLAGWASAAKQTIVVLGNPGFYEKAGFSRALAAQLDTPYPSEFTMMMGPHADPPKTTLVYPKAFD